MFIVCLLFTTEQKMPAKLEGLYDLTMILDRIDMCWNNPSDLFFASPVLPYGTTERSYLARGGFRIYSNVFPYRLVQIPRIRPYLHHPPPNQAFRFLGECELIFGIIFIIKREIWFDNELHVQ